jgi:hypothetical protein
MGVWCQEPFVQWGAPAGGFAGEYGLLRLADVDRLVLQADGDFSTGAAEQARRRRAVPGGASEACRLVQGEACLLDGLTTEQLFAA